MVILFSQVCQGRKSLKMSLNPWVQLTHLSADADDENHPQPQTSMGNQNPATNRLHPAAARESLQRDQAEPWGKVATHCHPAVDTWGFSLATMVSCVWETGSSRVAAETGSWANGQACLRPGTLWICLQRSSVLRVDLCLCCSRDSKSMTPTIGCLTEALSPQSARNTCCWLSAKIHKT